MLHIVRAIFVGVCGALGAAIGHELYNKAVLEGLIVGVLSGALIAVAAMAFTRRVASAVSTLMIGILVGCLVAYFVVQVLRLVLPAGNPQVDFYRSFGITVGLAFLSVLTLLQLKDDFKFVIPLIEFRREGVGGKPILLDTSAVIDGRVADVMDTKILDVPVVIPRFVLTELQQVADSQDAQKRVRGRRGLDILARLRKARGVRVEDAELPEVEGVDAKLVRLAKNLDARIVTTDFNLNKVAQVQGVEVVNLNDVAHALRPDVLPGEKLSVKILRAGENAGQGVGYLNDGTMVVAEDCAARVGQQVDLVVTNVRQTSAGRMIFSRPC
jgi:uncharacterized protein YacL